MSVNGRKKLVKLSCKFVQTKKPAHKCSNDPSFTKGNVQLVITHIAFVRKRHAIKLFFSSPDQFIFTGGRRFFKTKILKNRKVKSKKSQC